MSGPSSNTKVALISGATGYVGSAIARTLAQDGWSIAALYREASKEKVDALLSSLEGSGHAAYACRLEDNNEVLNTLETILTNQGPLLACIHAAWSKGERKKMIQCSSEEIMEEMQANIPMSFNLLSACATYFKKIDTGTLIGITTAGVALPEATKNLGAYIVGKYALQGILSTLHAELYESGVRVYSVAPDFMPGGMNADIPGAFIEMLKEKNPSGRLLEPKEVADVVASLCVSESKQFTHLIEPGPENH